MRPDCARACAFGLAVALALGAVATTTSQSAAQESTHARVVLHVEGMHCGSCATRLQDVLARIDGVIAASVSFDETRAVVRYDARRVTLARLVRAAEDAGFRAREGAAH